MLLLVWLGMLAMMSELGCTGTCCLLNAYLTCISGRVSFGDVDQCNISDRGCTIVIVVDVYGWHCNIPLMVVH